MTNDAGKQVSSAKAFCLPLIPVGSKQSNAIEWLEEVKRAEEEEKSKEPSNSRKLCWTWGSFRRGCRRSVMRFRPIGFGIKTPRLKVKMSFSEAFPSRRRNWNTYSWSSSRCCWLMGCTVLRWCLEALFVGLSPSALRRVALAEPAKSELKLTTSSFECEMTIRSSFSSRHYAKKQWILLPTMKFQSVVAHESDNSAEESSCLVVWMNCPWCLWPFFSSRRLLPNIDRANQLNVVDMGRFNACKWLRDISKKSLSCYSHYVLPSHHCRFPSSSYGIIN